MRVVANTGPLIHLSWIDQLDLLPILFGEVIVPVAVREEVLRASFSVPGVFALHAAFAAGWLTVQSVSSSEEVAKLSSALDRGEAEAIVLSGQVGSDLLLIDERLGRTRAQGLSLPISGTIGILRMARDRGLITAVTPLLEDLRRRGFRISVQLMEQVRREEMRQRPP